MTTGEQKKEADFKKIWLYLSPLYVLGLVVFGVWMFRGDAEESAPPQKGHGNPFASASTAAADARKGVSIADADKQSQVPQVALQPSQSSMMVYYSSFQVVASSSPKEEIPQDHPAMSKIKKTLLSGGQTFSSMALKVVTGNKTLAKVFFNNDLVAKIALRNLGGVGALRNKDTVVDYINTNPEAQKLLSSQALQSIAGDKELLDIVVNSKVMDKLMDNPAIASACGDSDSLQRVVMSNPALVTVLTNPNFVSSLSSNPKTAGLASRMEKVTAN